MADINYTVNQDSPENIEGFEQYSQEDKNLINSFQINSVFDPEKNYSELHILSLSDELLESDYLYNRHKQLGNAQSAGQDGASVLTIDPIADSKYYGYEGAGIKLLYHFLDDLYTDDITTREFFIQDISPDRTEIVLNSLNITQEQVVSYTANIKSKIDTQSYFAGFRLNFKDNDLIIATNIDTIDFGTTNVVAVKLYEPLPDTYDLKSTLTVVEIVSDSIAYEVDSEYILEPEQAPTLRPANFNIEIADESVVPTQYLNYNELFSYPVSNANNEVHSLINEKGIDISVDYTNFNDFIHFSSAQERLLNFKYKLDLIDGYYEKIASGSRAVIGLTAITGSKNKYEELVTGVVSNFDHYERFLYYESGSSSWPKENNTKPYINQVGTTEARDWYSTQATTAALYDQSNSNSLLYSIPVYLRDDENNENYLTFVYMIGQHFDNLWLYSKAVTDKYDADNRLNKGISKDLVAEALKNFGVKLYTSNKTIEDLFTTFTGQAYQSGSEVINHYITGSLTGSNTPIQPTSYDNYQKEIQKRIYHNLPFLLKTKGTERGLRALINCFGIPSDILKIKQYGGVDTDSVPFLGDQQYFTSSLGKIRLDNAGTAVQGSTLSNSVSILKNNSKYTTDLHTVEIGLSPTDNVDEIIKKLNSDTCSKYKMTVTQASTDTYTYIDCFSGKTIQEVCDITRTFYAVTDSVVYDQDASQYSLSFSSTPNNIQDIDYYLGDPNNLNLHNYSGLHTSAESLLKILTTYDLQDYVRLIKFFDNTIFKMVKDFIPARSVATTGIIIKPNLLNISKAKSVSVSVTQPEHISSIDTAFISGSDGGIFTTTQPRTYQQTRYDTTCAQYTITITQQDDQQKYSYANCTTGLLEEYAYDQDRTFSAIIGSVLIDSNKATLTSADIVYTQDTIDQGMHQLQDTSYKETLRTPQGQREGFKNWQTDMPLYTGELQGTELDVAGTEVNFNNPFKQYNHEVQTNTIIVVSEVPENVCGVRGGSLTPITVTSKSSRNLQPDFAYINANAMQYSIGGQPITTNYLFPNNYTTYTVKAELPSPENCNNTRNYITRYCDMSIKRVPQSSEVSHSKVVNITDYFNVGSNPQVYWDYSGSNRSGTTIIAVNKRIYLPGASSHSGIPVSTGNNNKADQFKIEGAAGTTFTLKMYDYKTGLTPPAATTCFTSTMTLVIPEIYNQTANKMDQLKVGLDAGYSTIAEGVVQYERIPIKIKLTAKSPGGGWNPPNNITQKGQRTYSYTYIKLYAGANFQNESGLVGTLTVGSGGDAQVQEGSQIFELGANVMGGIVLGSTLDVRITLAYSLGEQGSTSAGNTWGTAIITT